MKAEAHRSRPRTTQAGEALASIEIRKDPLTVEDRVVQGLRDVIVSGQLTGGTRLTHRELADRLGVSPTPIRVALNRLDNDGLVVISPTGRAIVSHLSREEFEELHVVRLALEGLAARLGARAVSEGELVRMRALHEELVGFGLSQATTPYLRTRWEFYSTCYGASHRERLLGEVERLFWRAERYNHLIFSTRQHFAASVAYHERFLEACERNDSAAAERVLHEGIQWGATQLLPLLPSESELTDED